MSQESKSQIIAVCSFKGGTAKTSTTLHLGAALASFHKKKVLLIDFDSQANLTAGLGFNPDEYDSLASPLKGDATIESTIIKSPVKNLSLIPADSFLERIEVTESLARDRYSHERLKTLLSPLSFDFILIDTPPSLCWLTESALIAASHALIVATPEFYSVKGLHRLSFFLNEIKERHPFHILGVLLSFWNHRGKNNEAFLEVIESVFPNKVLKSKVRRDIAVSEGSIRGKPVFQTAPHSRAALDYRNATKELLKHFEEAFAL